MSVRPLGLRGRARRRGQRSRRRRVRLDPLGRPAQPCHGPRRSRLEPARKRPNGCRTSARSHPVRAPESTAPGTRSSPGSAGMATNSGSSRPGCLRAACSTLLRRTPRTAGAPPTRVLAIEPGGDAAIPRGGAGGGVAQRVQVRRLPAERRCLGSCPRVRVGADAVEPRGRRPGGRQDPAGLAGVPTATTTRLSTRWARR